MLAEKWITANAKPEIAIPLKESMFKIPSSITENLVGFIKTSQSKSMNNLTSSLNKMSYESTTMIRNKSTEESRVEINTGITIFYYVNKNCDLYYLLFDLLAYSLETSRDSPSQDSLSQVSEVSDQAAPILGRRATRERTTVITARHSDDSDSDLDVSVFKVNAILFCSSFVFYTLCENKIFFRMTKQEFQTSVILEKIY